MKRLLSILYISMLCILLLVVISCSGKRAHNLAGEQKVNTLSCLVILPTRTNVATSQDIKYGDAEMLEGGAALIDSVIADVISKSKASRVISANQIDALSTEIAGGKLGMLRSLGRQTNCNTVLVTTLLRFQQRQGTEYAVDRPAAASFEMRIVDVSSGSILWSATFSETQQSLLSNLFSFGKAQSRGFKWITAEQLVRKGVQERLSKCPYLF